MNSFKNSPIVLNKFFLDERAANVKFSFELENNEMEFVNAHTIILANGSEVFENMFYSDFDKPTVIKITDINPNAFKEFLHLENIELTMENITDVFYLVNKHIVPKFFPICEQFLKENMLVSLLCWAIEAADMYNRDAFKIMCFDMVADKSSELLSCDSFLQCKHTTLKKILTSWLTCSAMEVFEACEAWSYNSCIQNNLEPTVENRKQQLG